MKSEPPHDTTYLQASRAIERACGQLKNALAVLGTRFPHETTTGNTYGLAHRAGKPDGVNCSWTSGFWTGLLWLAHEMQPQEGFADAAQGQLASYTQRLADNYELDHHDLGFLFVPSCVAAHRVTGEPEGRELALQASELLMRRYLPSAGVIQAWGCLSDPREQGRMIIDCLMNLPLLHWAAAETGKSEPREAAIRHAQRSQQFLVREDFTSFHTYHFDPTTGAPLHGTTAQGASDTSCWARGQAWGIYGFALNHRWAPELGLLDTAIQMANVFIAGLPPHGVAMWDLKFDESSGEPWDSSASAIAVCGLLEIVEQLPPGEQADALTQKADHILAGLLQHCAGWGAPGNALLRHGVYSKPHGQGVDEASLWGDYYFLEALARRARNWLPFWRVAPTAAQRHL